MSVPTSQLSHRISPTQALRTPNEKEEPMADSPKSHEPSPAAASPSVTLRPKLAMPKRFAWIRKLGAGIFLDIRARAPWYISDWSDAWNYRVVPATALIFFAK